MDGSGNLYVANRGGDSIVVYPPGASGNATPTRTIAGNNTTLHTPQGIAVSSAGLIYSVGFGGPDLVWIFSASANGNVAPAATIAGAATNIASPEDVVLDATGNIYVSNSLNFNVTMYPPGTTGNTPPAATIGHGVNGVDPFPLGMAVR